MIKNKFKNIEHSSHHLERYLKFLSYCIDINNQLSLDCQPLFLEKHHILPKHTFPQYANITFNTWNSIKLTPRQHYIAHIMLYNIFRGRNKYLASCSIYRMRKGVEKVNSRLYEIVKLYQSNNMRINNPMKNKDTVEKAKQSLKKYYDSEEGKIKRKEIGLSKIGINNISKEGIIKLSNLWKGVKRPKKAGQIEKTIKSQALGIFHTPFGDFYSPNQARLSPNNPNLSRHVINKKCKNNRDGYSFTSFNKETKRGKWERVRKTDK